MPGWSDIAAEPFRCGDGAPQSPGEAPPGHETLVQHAQATVAAEGAPDEALVERVARAMAGSVGRDWDIMSDPQDVAWFDDCEKGWWRDLARAAIRAMGGGE